MTSSGSKYVAGVFAVLAAYGVYEWWFNPVRAIKRELGELAATISVPEAESELTRIGRVAQLRRFFAEDVRVTVGASGPDITSRDALLAAVIAFRPPSGGWDVQLVDLQVTVESDESARAYMTVEIRGRDARTGEQTVDAREARVSVAKRNGGWVITTAESPETLRRP